MNKLGMFFLGIIIVVVIAIAIFVSNQQKLPLITPTTIAASPTQKLPTSIPSTSPSVAIAYCASDKLDASVSLSPGAGNVYGTFSLKNTSQKTCEILGGNFIEAQYATIITNIKITHIGQTQQQPFILTPNKIVYSQVHYPNGPQCQSIGLNQVPITFIYKISPTQNVTFKNAQTNTTQQIVQACKSTSDITEIQLWNMALTPITPQ